MVVGGYFVYKNFVIEPKEEKADGCNVESGGIFQAGFFKLALNGDGQYLGFLKVIDKYGGTKAGNLAKFYAGSCYLKLGDYSTMPLNI